MGPERGTGRSLDALRHPLRVRIIEVCTEWGPISPKEIVNRGLCGDVLDLKRKSHKQQLSNISYHCRRLQAAGLLTLDREEPARGATEHFFSANAEAFFGDAEWAALDFEERAEISKVMWQRFIAAVESALIADTFDSRVNRMLGWCPITLDETGWDELAAHMADSFHVIERIRSAAEARLSEPGAIPLRATYGLFCFESPLHPKSGPDQK